MGVKQVAGGYLAADGSATTVTFSATPVFDLNTGNVFLITLTGNVTSSTFANVPADATTIKIILRQDSTGSRTVVLPTTVRYAGGSQGNTTTLSTESIYTFTYDPGLALWIESQARVLAVPVT
jgi:hypothetical protein